MQNKRIMPRLLLQPIELFMFSRTFEKMKQDNISIWKGTEGNYFAKAMSLFRNYCGYERYAITYYTLYSVNSHKDEIYNIISMYEEREYLLNHKNALVCNIAFLLFFISRKIPRDKLRPDGGFVALIHVIEENTGIKMNMFYQDNLSLQAYFKSDEIHQDFLQCKSWTEFILKNVNNFLPSIENEYGIIKHPINLKSLRHKYGRVTASDVIETCTKKISPAASEINLLLYCDQEHAWRQSDDLTDLFDSAVAKLPSKHLEYFFALTLKEKAYFVAWKLFYIAENLEKITEKEFFYSFQATYANMMDEIFKAIIKPVGSNLLVKAIEYGKRLELLDHERKYYYISLYTKKEFIDEFKKVEAALITCFKPKMYEVFLNALETENKALIRYLIHTNKIDLRNNKIISYDYSYEWNHDFFYGFSEKQGISFTPLQAALFWSSFPSANPDLSFLHEVIEIMIKHDSGSVIIKDSIERSVRYYFNRMKANVYSSSHKKNEEESKVGKISNLLNQAYFYEPIYVNYQILKEFTNAYYPNFPTELIVLISTLLKNLPSSMNSTEKFGIELKCNSFKKSLSYFCNFYGIADIPPDKEISLENVLMEFFNLIEKPVHSSFMLQFFDKIALEFNNKRRNCKKNLWDLPNPRYMEYLSLCRKKHLIENWRQTEIQFRKYFKPKLNSAFEFLMENQNYSEITSLFNELMQNIIFDPENNYYFQVLLNSWVPTLIKKAPRFVDHLTPEFFSNFDQIKNLKNIWDTRDLQEFCDGFETLKSQYYFKFGSFFMKKNPSFPESAMSEIEDRRDVHALQKK